MMKALILAVELRGCISKMISLEAMGLMGLKLLNSTLLIIIPVSVAAQYKWHFVSIHLHWDQCNRRGLSRK